MACEASRRIVSRGIARCYSMLFRTDPRLRFRLFLLTRAFRPSLYLPKRLESCGVRTLDMLRRIHSFCHAARPSELRTDYLDASGWSLRASYPTLHREHSTCPARLIAFDPRRFVARAGVCYMKKRAHLRADRRRTPVPNRCSIRVGFGGGAVGRTAGCAWAGGSGAGRGSRGYADARDAERRRHRRPRLGC